MPVQFLTPSVMAENIGMNLFDSEKLDSFVWDSLKLWGFFPTKNRFAKPAALNLHSTFSANDCLYPSIPFVLNIVRSFFKSEETTLPSKDWADAATIAVNLGYPGYLGRSALNEMIVNKGLDMGLYPWKSRLGAESLTFYSSDGGIYPTNNPLVADWIKGFFEHLPPFKKDSIDLKFCAKVIEIKDAQSLWNPQWSQSFKSVA